ncbi:MAG: uncharacterized protein QOF33_3766 [Thermomicrobiales bacterium]|jgi:predicted TIM-barrel fold metal-dependent hydrolase|nr:uncharacterized protein [Thermomicrobiales bacterium]MEA2585681.1 uncharacterized protein [Thermomicrobiales bacterium]
MNLDAIPAIDTHCHPFPPSQRAITGQMLRDAISVSLRGETPSDNESMLLSRMVIKGLARFLGCKPDWDSVMEARNARAEADVAEYHRGLFAEAGISAVLIDPGYPSEYISPADFATVMPCPVYEGYRVERFASNYGSATAFATEGFGSFVDFVDAFRETIDREAAKPDLRYLKSVIAYISGLAIRKVSEQEALAAWQEQPAHGDPAEKVLRDYLFWETALKAREHGLPFQVHTGHTSHVNPWPNVNPILMTPLLNQPEMHDVPFVLVHGGYPFCTEAGYLTSVFPNVSLDLSLMIPWSSIGIARRIEETLESAPTSKVMYGSDGINVPELYWISALNTRKALGRVLDRLVGEEVLDEDEALEVGRDILYRNAERIYGISIQAGGTA